MATIVQGGTITATYGSGTAITKVLKAHTALGLDLAVGEASFSVPTVADLNGATYFSIVTIILSAGTHTAEWIGYITDFDYTLYPREIGVICKGFLVKAELEANPAIGGTDTTNSGAGKSDNDMASQILTACGIVDGGGGGAPPVLAIGGTTRLLGTKATQNYIWAEGETGLSFIHRLDEICADITGGSVCYRTYDDAAGTVYRQAVSSVPGVSALYTFTEGVDIFSGTSKQTIYPAKNRIVVTGYDDGLGLGPVTFSKQAANAYIPTPPQYISYQLSSALIEYDTEAHRPTGKGISCEAVATFQLSQWNRTQVQVQFTTPKDDVILLNQTMLVQGYGGTTGRLGVNGNFWTQRVERDVDTKGVFTQTITAIAGAA